MLAADRQLATEIEFDLKKWEDEQKKHEEVRRETQVLRTTGPVRFLLILFFFPPSSFFASFGSYIFLCF